MIGGRKRKREGRDLHEMRIDCALEREGGREGARERDLHELRCYATVNNGKCSSSKQETNRARLV